MLVGKATGVLFRNVLLKAETTSLKVVCPRCPHTKPLLLFSLQQRYKNASPKDKDRDRCKEKPPKSRKLLKLAALAVVGTTVAIVAAKHDDDFRDWSREHLPILDNMVKVVYEEEDTYLESLDKAHKAISAKIKNALYYLFKESRQSKPDTTRGPLSDQLGSIPPLEPCDESKKPYKPPESAFISKTDDAKSESTSKPVQVPKELKDLQQLEEKLSKTAQDAIQSVTSTVCALRDHAKLIDYLDQIISSGSTKVWDRLKKLQNDVTKGLEKSKADLVNFKSVEKQLTSKIKDNGNLTDDVRAKAQDNVNTVSKDVNDAMAKLEKAKENAILAKRSWDKAKQARLHFQEDLETLFPNVWLNDVNLNIPADQLDPFTENVLNNIEYLGRHLAKDQNICEAALNSAAEKYKNKDPGALEEFAKVIVPHELDKIKMKLQEELQKNILTHKAKCDKNAKAMMKQTKEVYADLTAEALKVKEKEVERKIQQKLDEQLAKARADYKMEVAKMVGRMQGANEAISKRGEKDKSEQDKQQFWSAAQSLVAAVKPIGAAAAEAQEPKPLKNEITNLTKVKPKGDELVDSVLSSIPSEAVERGVPSEASLREKFIKVMRCAKGWAGVPPGEVTLLQLLLARVQSALYLNVAIPQAELDNEPAIDPEQLNNYDILSRAKYYVDRNEFDQAIRYLNLLQGPASLVASDWVKDALLYLETRQAAELLLAHATSQS